MSLLTSFDGSLSLNTWLATDWLGRKSKSLFFSNASLILSFSCLKPLTYIYGSPTFFDGSSILNYSTVGLV